MRNSAKSGDSSDRTGTPQKTPGKTGVNQKSGTDSGTLKDDPATNRDADLALLLNAWPSLPGPIKAGIVAMVKAGMKNHIPFKIELTKAPGP